VSEEAVGPDRDGSDRLRQILTLALGGLALLGCLAIASELVREVWFVLAAQADSNGIQPMTQVGPYVVNAVIVQPTLILEAVVLEPLFIASLIGVWSLHGRRSFWLAVAGLVAFNLAALGFVGFAHGLDAGWSRGHRLAAILVPVIGLPIAELALWAIFKPDERARYAR